MYQHVKSTQSANWVKPVKLTTTLIPGEQF